MKNGFLSIKELIKISIFLLLSCTILLSCQRNEAEAPDPNDNVEIPEPEPELVITLPEDMGVILHAGGELDGKILLNCQEAFYFYYEIGCRIFEYDLKLSSDGRLIGTHSWEHLADGYDGISYEDFKSLVLDGGYTPVNEDWLVEILTEYSDITLIIDAKMETTTQDALVIKRLNELQTIHGIDISDKIIPEIFSVEMWEEIKDEVTFSYFLFSRYKEYYSVNFVVESFPIDRFIGIALPYTNLDGYYKRNIAYFQELGYRIFMFGIYSDGDVIGALEIGADTVYIDNLGMIPSID